MHVQGMRQSPVATVAAVVASGTDAVRTRILSRKLSVSGEHWAGERSCVLKLGMLLTLSTFDAQGVADMLNSREETTERMAGTKVRYFHIHSMYVVFYNGEFRIASE